MFFNLRHGLHAFLLRSMFESVRYAHMLRRSAKFNIMRIRESNFFAYFCTVLDLCKTSQHNL